MSGFNFKIEGHTKQAQLKDAWLESKCQSCPLLPHYYDRTNPLDVVPLDTSRKVDILVVNSPETVDISGYLVGHSYRQINQIECLRPAEFANEMARTCCQGRKLEVFDKCLPKLVICVGFSAFSEWEALAGFESDVEAKYIPLPTKLNGRNFWLMQLPDFGVGRDFNVVRFNKAVQHALSTTPEVLEPSLKGIEFATTPALVKAAFRDLKRMPYVGADTETNGLRPYFKDAKILSFALGNYDKTFGIPLMHPQTSALLDPADTLQQFYDLSKEVPLVAHMVKFEYEWIAKILGSAWLYESLLWEDTATLVYVLRTGGLSFKLEQALRREFGMNIKPLSNIDVTNLENLPIEQVLGYNCGDTKYLIPLFEKLFNRVEQEGLVDIYRKRLRNGRANIPLQKRGVDIDFNFIAQQRDHLSNLADSYDKEFHEVETVRQYEAKHGRIKISQRLDKLFHGFCGVDPKITSFDDEFLKNLNQPVAKVITKYRQESKLLSTYIEPLTLDDRVAVPWKHTYAKCRIMEDFRVHTEFSAIGTATGRLSSKGPNLQNFPKRGGKKHLRNVVICPPGYIMFAIDYAQIEARIIASLARDAKFMKAIWDDYDTHRYWTLYIINFFPEFFVDSSLKGQIDENGKDKFEVAVKVFRDEMKNNWTFPLLYNSSNKSIHEALALLTLPSIKQRFGEMGEPLHLPRKGVDQVIRDFWEHYPQIRFWQESLAVQMKQNGQIVTPFGQPMRDLEHTEYCNYSSQSAASDITTDAQDRVVQLGIKMGGKKFYIVINIHDDLTGYCKEEDLDDVLSEIIPIMVDKSRIKHWYHVPLACEVSTGYKWGELKTLGEFSSKDFGDRWEDIAA